MATHCMEIILRNRGNDIANDDADIDTYDDSQVKSPGWHSVKIRLFLHKINIK